MHGRFPWNNLDYIVPKCRPDRHIYEFMNANNSETKG